MTIIPGGAVLDVAIGLILMFLMLSLVGTTVNELIATLSQLRAKTLASALAEILDDQNLRANFYKSGLIESANAAVGKSAFWSRLFSRQVRPAANAASPAPPTVANTAATVTASGQGVDVPGHVSYLSSRDFAMAVLGSLDPAKPLPVLADVKQSIEAMPAGRIRDVLISSLATAGDDLEKLRDGVANWFDSAMDRVSGAYKRDIQYIAFVVGVLVAIAFNADTIHVGVALWQDTNLRSEMVDVATSVQKAGEPAAGAAASTVAQDVDAIKTSYDNAEATLQPLPIGWGQTKFATDFWSWVGRIAGWLLTGLAVSLGAPFWFDLLNKFMNLRGTGQQPPRADASGNSA